MTAFVDSYDVACFDLDGVLYLGLSAVPGAAAALAALRQRGVRTLFVTNNAARSETTVAEHLTSLGFEVGMDDLVTSAQATQGRLRETLPPGTRVLVTGSDNLVEHVRLAGMIPVLSADEDPAVVVMGYNPGLAWPILDEAALAIQRGALWIATNGDSTRPTDRGLVPGVGAMLAAVAMAVGRGPDEVVGKPHRALMLETQKRARGGKSVFVGDRIDTDIMGACAVGMDSFMVFTGTHGRRALLEAPPEARPSAIGWDVGSLLEPRRTASVADGVAVCGRVTVRASDAEVDMSGDLSDREGQLDALWALAQLVWGGQVSMERAAMANLDLLP